MDSVKWIVIAGVVLTCIGALFFGYELFRPFRGHTHGGIGAGNSDGFAHATKEFVSWEKRKMRAYKIGAFLVVVGSGMQVIATCMSKS